MAKTASKTSRVKKAPDHGKVVKVAAEELLASLEIPAEVTVTLVEDVYQVKVETEESGLLIGFHGETLSSFQLILGLVVYKRSLAAAAGKPAYAAKKLSEWVRVVVEVGDYRARREQQLRQMAESYAAQVVATGQPLALPSLPPIERRVVHLALQDRSDVVTESEGEGNERRVVIKPRQ